MFYKAIIKPLTTPTIVIFCFPLSALSTDSFRNYVHISKSHAYVTVYWFFLVLVLGNVH